MKYIQVYLYIYLFQIRNRFIMFPLDNIYITYISALIWWKWDSTFGYSPIITQFLSHFIDFIPNTIVVLDWTLVKRIRQKAIYVHTCAYYRKSVVPIQTSPRFPAIHRRNLVCETEQ